jgi:predicted DNA-binding transcriptional regulator AlpA
VLVVPPRRGICVRARYDPHVPAKRVIGDVPGLFIAAGTEVVTAREIARRLGISNGRIHQIIAADRAFPEPYGTLAGRIAWDWTRIAQWAADANRTIDTTPPGSSSYRAETDASVVTLTEVAILLGVSIPRAAELAERDTFPPRIGRFGRGILWDRNAIVHYREHRPDRRGVSTRVDG